MAPTRVPSQEDFASLSLPPALAVSLAFPSPPESTTAIMLLFHGLGDSEAPFAGFARNLALPGVLAVSVRGTAALPPAMIGGGDGPAQHFYWGDDLTLSPATGELDQDPGFGKARKLVMERLVDEVLVEKCGWELDDMLLFGFGQGGSLALGLASEARMGKRVEEVSAAEEESQEKKKDAFKGVVSIGGALPPSMIPSISTRPKAQTPVLICHGSASEVVDEDAIDTLREEFASVEVARWNRPDDGMPQSREEVLPLMQFFANRLRNEW